MGEKFVFNFDKLKRYFLSERLKSNPEYVKGTNIFYLNFYISMS